MSHQDTPQQRAILRQNASARKTRRRFPAGTRIAAVAGTPPHVTGTGTVARHIPGANAQGGSLTVDWDNGTRGHLGPINARRLDEVQVSIEDPDSPHGAPAYDGPVADVHQFLMPAVYEGVDPEGNVMRLDVGINHVVAEVIR